LIRWREMSSTTLIDRGIGLSCCLMSLVGWFLYFVCNFLMQSKGFEICFVIDQSIIKMLLTIVLFSKGFLISQKFKITFYNILE